MTPTTTAKSPVTVEALRRYGASLGLVLVAFGITSLIWIFVKSLPSPLFLIAIAVSARFYGLWPGFASTLVSAFLIDFFFMTPEFQLSGNTDDLLRLGIFVLEGVAFCLLIDKGSAVEAQLRESAQKLIALTRRQEALVEQERKRIALEIHDELGQALTGLKMELHLLRSAPQPAEAWVEHRGVFDTVDSIIQSVRRIATDLRPPILDDLGLVAAAEWQTREFEKRTGIECRFVASADRVDLDSEAATAIFRILQEALTNSARHARATRISVRLAVTDRSLFLEVEDNGIGMEQGPDGSLGLLGMQERSRMIGGDLKIIASAGAGTMVVLRAPLAR